MDIIKEKIARKLGESVKRANERARVNKIKKDNLRRFKAVKIQRAWRECLYRKKAKALEILER